MTATVITTCSNRKRVAPDPALAAAGLSRGDTDAVARAWSGRLAAANPTVSARALYGGRGFREAEAASRLIGGAFYVVSAGLGVVAADSLVPAYGLTLNRRHADGVLEKIDGGPADWWSAVSRHSPFHSALPENGQPTLAALSAPYLDMVGQAWGQWPATRLAGLRIFSKERPAGLPAPLTAAWMPYDDRLDAAGPGYAGTQADFAQRALRHFVATVGVSCQGAAADAEAVRSALSGLDQRTLPERRRLDDNEVCALILAEWNAVGGRSGAMLRRFRDTLGVACEQSRFKDLFHKASLLRQERSV